MKYKDQLVLTGRINDVGAYTRTNIPDSYRAGIELQGQATISKKINVAANISLSKNKIKDFTEYLDDYDNGGQQTKFYAKTDISFSSSIVASGTINLLPMKNGEINLRPILNTNNLINTSFSIQINGNSFVSNKKQDGFLVKKPGPRF